MCFRRAPKNKAAAQEGRSSKRTRTGAVGPTDSVTLGTSDTPDGVVAPGPPILPKDSAPQWDIPQAVAVEVKKLLPGIMADTIS